MKVHRFDAKLWLPRPIDEIFRFFADASNLERITPPILKFRVITSTPARMAVGARIRHRFRMHGSPLFLGERNHRLGTPASLYRRSNTRPEPPVETRTPLRGARRRHRDPQPRNLRRLGRFADECHIRSTRCPEHLGISHTSSDSMVPRQVLTYCQPRCRPHPRSSRLRR
jgi:hypothetical protein